MLLFKKLLLANVLGAGVVVPAVALTRPEEKIEKLELNETIKKWEQFLQKISGDNNSEKLSKVFSKNLTTFSKSAIVNSVKHLLMTWAIDIWNDPDSYFPISQRLNKFFFYPHIHQWQVKREIEELSWDLLKKFFIDFFFKDKGWFLLSEFGKFSSFVLKKWREMERPMQIYEWTIKYSNSGDSRQSPSSSGSLYEETVLEDSKGKPPYLFPEIKDNKEYSSFISKLTHTGEIDLSHFKKTLLTISDLTKLTDGYKLGSLIYLFTQQNHSNASRSEFSKIADQDESITELELEEPNKNNKLDISKNPLYLFLGKQENNDCLLIHNSLFTDEIKSKLISEGDGSTCLYGARWLIKNNSNNLNGENKKVLVSREKDGISFYYISKASNIKEEKDDEVLNKQDPEIISKVTQYLEKNFETIFLKYLLEERKIKNGSEENVNYTPFTLNPINHQIDNEKKWDFNEFLKKHKEIIEASLSYSDALYWGETIKKLQVILLNVYQNTPEELELLNESRGEEKSRNIKLPRKVGLFNPLFNKRSGDVFEKIKEFDFSESETNEKNTPYKNWFFDDLISFLFGDESTEKLLSLERKANTLKELLSQNGGEELFTSSLNNLFSSDLYRAQLEIISNDKLKSADTVFVSKAEEILLLNEGKPDSKKQNNFSDWIREYVSTLGSGEQNGTGGMNWSELIDSGLFLETFLKGSIAEKIFLQSLEKSEDDLNKQDVSTLAKNKWLLDTFYLSDSAYESSSDNYKDFLAFLLSVQWLVKNGYENISKIINEIFKRNKNKNAFLVWVRQITEEEKENLEKKSNETSSQSLADNPTKDPKEELKKFLEKETLADDITNPLLKGQFKMANDSGSNTNLAGQQSQTEKLSFSSDNSIYKVNAFKIKDSEKIKLSEFKGLFTESFSTRDLPKSLKDYLFKNFFKFNDPTNTNYSTEGSSAGVAQQKRFNEGAFFSDNQKRKLDSNKDLAEIISNVNKKERLLKYLDGSTISINEALRREDKKINDLTLQQLKEILNKSLNSDENKLTADSPNSTKSISEDLYKLFNRFSGYLYSGEGKERSPYVFTEGEGEEKKHYVGFVYQVNQFDFEKDGIKELKTNLSEETLNTLVVLLASNPSIRNWIWHSELIKHLALT